MSRRGCWGLPPAACFEGACRRNIGDACAWLPKTKQPPFYQCRSSAQVQDVLETVLRGQILLFRNRCVAGETTFLEMRIKSATLSGLPSPGPASLVSVACLLAGRPLHGPTVAVPARTTLRHNCADAYRFGSFSGVRSFRFELIRLFAPEKVLSQEKCSGGGCKQYLLRVRKPLILGAERQISSFEQVENEDDQTPNQYS